MLGVNRELFSPGLLDGIAAPAMDIEERDEEFIVSADLPGVDMKALDLTIANNLLTIKGSKPPFKIPEHAALRRNELWGDEFHRTVSFPKAVNADMVSATLADGILRVVLPKREELKPKKITVNVR